MNQLTIPLATCATCSKPSWNMRDIKYSKWKFKAYYCAEHAPYTQKPHQSDEVSTPDVNPRPDIAMMSEPVYQRPQEEVQAEIDWLNLNPIENIPL